MPLCCLVKGFCVFSFTLSPFHQISAWASLGGHVAVGICRRSDDFLAARCRYVGVERMPLCWEWMQSELMSHFVYVCSCGGVNVAQVHGFLSNRVHGICCGLQGVAHLGMCHSIWHYGCVLSLQSDGSDASVTGMVPNARRCFES